MTMKGGPKAHGHPWGENTLSRGSLGGKYPPTPYVCPPQMAPLILGLDYVDSRGPGSRPISHLYRFLPIFTSHTVD